MYDFRAKFVLADLRCRWWRTPKLEEKSALCTCNIDDDDDDGKYALQVLSVRGTYPLVGRDWP